MGLGRLLHPTRLFQSDYHSISVRASADFSTHGGTITSLSLEQAVLAVFRPRPHLPSPTVAPENNQKAKKLSASSRGSKNSGRGSDSSSGAGEEDENIPKSPEDWSIASLLLPPSMAADWLKSVRSSESQSPSLSRSNKAILQGCPVASRSAIDVLEDSKRDWTKGRGNYGSGYDFDDVFAPARSDAAAAATPEDDVSETSKGRTCEAAAVSEDLPQETGCNLSDGGKNARESMGDILAPPGVSTRFLLSSRATEDDVGGTVGEFITAKLWSGLDSGRRHGPREETDQVGNYDHGDKVSRQQQETRGRDPIVPGLDRRREEPTQERGEIHGNGNDDGPKDIFHSSDGISRIQEASLNGNRGVGGEQAASWDPAVARLDHFLAGRGGTRGVSVSHVINLHPDADALVDFLQPVPYFMIPLLGTLRARLVPLDDGGVVRRSDATKSQPPSPSTINQGNGDRVHMPKNPQITKLEAITPHDTAAVFSPLFGEVSLTGNITLTPGEGRSPAIVEAKLWVPAGSTLVLGFDFFKRFLAVDDFPPDPSRGFDVPAPLARFSFIQSSGLGNDPTSGTKDVVGESKRKGVSTDALWQGNDGQLLRAGGSDVATRVVYAYGEAGLLDTPQPDFSMPFNVITFTSTVITFFLGTAINLLVRKSARRGKSKTQGGGGGRTWKPQGGRRLVKRAWARWKGRGTGEGRGT